MANIKNSISNGMKVKIIGAGSIGNHLAQASRRIGWDVVVVDNDSKALDRMKTDIYPTRYGRWDEQIELFTSGQEPKGGFDIIMIGTPPDSHMKLALAAMEESPKLLHIEKPLCTPNLEEIEAFNQARQAHTDTLVTVGYDHAVAKSIQTIGEYVTQGLIGEIITLDVEFREHWSGIFAAHPWLAGPHASYLGYWQRGGGAGGEHSHALHLWLSLAHLIGWQVAEVKANFDFQTDSNGADYDQIAAFNLKTKQGNIGRVIQDVVTQPPRKWLRLQGTKGFIEWFCTGAAGGGDLIKYQSENGEVEEKIFDKKRPDDFYQLVNHYQDLLAGKIKIEDSPLNYDRGLEVMKILNQAYPGSK